MCDRETLRGAWDGVAAARDVVATEVNRTGLMQRVMEEGGPLKRQAEKDEPLGFIVCLCEESCTFRLVSCNH